ncbi:MAG: 4Fe-4S dicluster domain-containing protein [Chloroflexi bacterium]|nr:4Fe-4S dicluster domain-containing protein [Chloroflexota bacterium]
MPRSKDTAAKLKEHLKSRGVDLVGIADLANVPTFETIPPDLASPFCRAISLAIRLSDPIVDAITISDPTPAYAQHYRAVNGVLDSLTDHTVSHIKTQGYLALSIPASRTVDKEGFRAAASHKVLAQAAGLGWIGKSQLLVNADLGPRLRLATVFTNWPLTSDEPVAERCGNCITCIAACPAGAIEGRERNTDRPGEKYLFHLQKCDERLRFFARKPQIGSRVCGLCVQACPWGKVKDR